MALLEAPVKKIKMMTKRFYELIALSSFVAYTLIIRGEKI